MALAHTVGLNVPSTFIHQNGDTRVFVVRRYDRVATGDGIRRLQQEAATGGFLSGALHSPSVQV